MRTLSILGLALAAVLAFAGAAQAQADLTTVDQMKIHVDGADETITVLQDVWKKTQWYYVPARPRLVERKLDGSKAPVFNLVRYQFRTGQTFDEGGIMQFAVTFAVPDSSLSLIKAQIAAKMSAASPTERIGAQDISLAALPINNAHFYLYSPGGETMMTSDTPSEGMAPTFANQQLPFSLSLTEKGGAVFETITTDTLGGVPVIVVMEYTGLTAPAGFRCTINWDNTYRALSSDTKLTAALSGVPYVTPKVDAGYYNLRSTMEKRGCIKLEVIEGETFKLEDADRYLQPILELMAREMLEMPAAPADVSPSVPKQKNPLMDLVGKIGPQVVKMVQGGGTGSPATPGVPSADIQLQFSMRDIKQVRKGSQTYSMNVRRAMKQSTVCGGFIGIGGYSETVRKKLVQVVPSGDWEKAWLSLPRIVPDADLNIESVTFTASLNDGTKNYDQQVAQWAPGTGWTGLGATNQTEAIERFAFATQSLKAALGAKWQNSFFSVSSQIKYKPALTAPRTYTINSSGKTPLFSGNAPLSSPLDTTDVWVFDANYCYFTADDPGAELKSMSVTVAANTDPALSVRAFIDPSRNKVRTLPVLIAKDATSVTANVLFMLSNGKQMKWEFNGKNLKELPDYAGGLVQFSDFDLMTATE